MASEEYPDVDFVVGAPAAGHRAEYPAPRGPKQHPPGEHRRLGLVLAAAALVAAGLTARALTSEHASTASVRRTPSTPSSAISRPTQPRSPTTAELADCPQAGDGESLCSRTDTVPADVLAAVRARFPGARAESARTEQLRDVGYGPGGLWFREVHARVGRLEIVVEVHRRRGTDVSGGTMNDDGASSISTYTLAGSALTVQVSATSPSGHPVDYAAMTALVVDKRLQAL